MVREGSRIENCPQRLLFSRRLLGPLLGLEVEKFCFSGHLKRSRTDCRRCLRLGHELLPRIGLRPYWRSPCGS